MWRTCDALRMTVDQRKHAVVRRHKIVSSSGQKNRPPRCAYARIDDYEVDRPIGEIRVRLGDSQGAVENIERLYRMADVHDFSFRSNIQNDALDSPDEMIVEPEVGGQSDKRTVRQCSSLSEAELCPENSKVTCHRERRQDTEVIGQLPQTPLTRTAALLPDRGETLSALGKTLRLRPPATGW